MSSGFFWPFSYSLNTVVLLSGIVLAFRTLGLLSVKISQFSCQRGGCNWLRGDSLAPMVHSRLERRPFRSEMIYLSIVCSQRSRDDWLRIDVINCWLWIRCVVVCFGFLFLHCLSLVTSCHFQSGFCSQFSLNDGVLLSMKICRYHDGLVYRLLCSECVVAFFTLDYLVTFLLFQWGEANCFQVRSWGTVGYWFQIDSYKNSIFLIRNFWIRSYNGMSELSPFCLFHGLLWMSSCKLAALPFSCALWAACRVHISRMRFSNWCLHTRYVNASQKRLFSWLFLPDDVLFFFRSSTDIFKR